MEAQILSLPTRKLAKKESRQFPRLVSISPARQHPILDALKSAEYGHLLLSTPEGHSFAFGGYKPGPNAHLRLNDWKALDALVARGETGFAEAYAAGLWDSNDLPAILAFGLANADSLECYFYGKPLHALWMRLKSKLHLNSLSGSKRNITEHYDLGNEFYELWLDKSMTYSGAIFGNNHKLSLEDAQQAKYHRILDSLDAKPGDHILEIGCGWGGFAETAARKGIHITGITISEAQKTYADERLYNNSLDNLATIELTDYRKISGQFDHIVSIGMFEHVGEKYWPIFFNTIKSCLKPDGKAIIQTITIDDAVFKRTQNKISFIDQKIFPGCYLPSRERFQKAAECAGLICQNPFRFGKDHALTLGNWMKRFNTHQHEIKQMGYDDDFICMWRFYLASCIAGFITGRIDVMQAEMIHAESFSQPQHGGLHEKTKAFRCF